MTGRRFHSPRRQTLGQIFLVPLVLGILSTVGLISALVGDGVWDGVSWITLGIPILLCAYFLLKPRRS
ncbi:hypothetical protein [Bradyrhizobium sp. SYSU BS000235]|uniref:hypothetical protein n=1 Tax=Bradyrhizobium sp. SYSU BS000235 TaxID=3411332 RepID=UPI003C72B45B